MGRVAPCGSVRLRAAILAHTPPPLVRRMESGDLLDGKLSAPSHGGGEVSRFYSTPEHWFDQKIKRGG